MDIPENYRFSDDHEWADDQGDGTVIVGISHHAQDALGDIVFVELHGEDGSLEQGDDFGVVESVKTVSDLFAPLSGEIVAFNEALEEEPELVNEDPYDRGWIVRIKMSDPSQLEGLMDADEYAEFLSEGA